MLERAAFTAAQTDRQTDRDRQRNAQPKPRTTVGVVWRTDTQLPIPPPLAIQVQRAAHSEEQLAEMQKDYHPDQFDTEKDTSIDALRRNWTFLSNLEKAIRKTNEHKVIIKKKEVAIREQCVGLESEVKKYETLESRAATNRKKAEVLKENKAADEMAASYWLRQKNE